ncbi:hypothetical protein [Streptomyces sp. BV129]|nr:hypothetical protein [Streptomyces sp. BV129]
MTDHAPTCPECGRLMKSGGLVLSERMDDGRRPADLPITVEVH